MRIRSFIAWFSNPGNQRRVDTEGRPGASDREWLRWQQDGLHVRYVPRDGTASAATQLPLLVLGDDGEWESGAPDANLASGVPIRYDASAAELIVSTSIVALPPVFLYRGADLTAVTSDLYLLREIAGVRLELDANAVIEHGHFGHPVGHRTLFRNVELVPAASRLRFGPRRATTVERSWQLQTRPRADWPDFIEMQIAAFSNQLHRLDVSKSVLSLTAGLDTRTVFSGLAAEQRLIPAVTMTGARRSLDARTAARLCRAYGVRHHAVTFDSGFMSRLAGYVEDASRLSGGLASLDQAPEVHLYHELGSGYSARLSGNLGNQVGRGGTEGVSMRGADLDVIGAPLRAPVPAGHWLLEQLGGDERSTLTFILHNEIPFTLMSNFPVGNHFAAQQSPYASRTLIETLALRPATRAGAPSGSKLRMRLRDLKHRFLGEPERVSFQRTLVKRLDGFAARYPVNWGWRPSGGVSPTGLAIGTATLFGMFARAKGLDGGAWRRPLEWSGLPALHDFRESRRWLRETLREFTIDTVTSAAARDAGLFEQRALTRVLDEHFQGQRDHYHTVTYALDIALAHRIFCL